MDFRTAIADAVVANQPEVESALASVRTSHARATGEVRELERTINMLEGVLELARAGGADDPAPASMTLHEAMREVLQAAPMRMMRAHDLAAMIDHLRLYRMRDGRVVEPQQIHARTGNYPDLFEREGTFIKLK